MTDLADEVRHEAQRAAPLRKDRRDACAGAPHALRKDEPEVQRNVRHAHSGEHRERRQRVLLAQADALTHIHQHNRWRCERAP